MAIDARAADGRQPTGRDVSRPGWPGAAAVAAPADAAGAASRCRSPSR